MKMLFLTGPHAVGKSYFMQQLATTNNALNFSDIYLPGENTISASIVYIFS